MMENFMVTVKIGKSVHKIILDISGTFYSHFKHNLQIFVILTPKWIATNPNSFFFIDILSLTNWPISIPYTQFFLYKPPVLTMSI